MFRNRIIVDVMAVSYTHLDVYKRQANAYTELMNQQSGKVMGIGVELGMDQTGYARVTTIPASCAGESSYTLVTLA